jgi:hypothetical protein
VIVSKELPRFSHNAFARLAASMKSSAALEWNFRQYAMPTASGGGAGRKREFSIADLPNHCVVAQSPKLKDPI